MSQLWQIHPDNPQSRLISQAADILRRGGVIAMPTDACYVLACALNAKAGEEKLRRILGVDDRFPLSVMCRDLAELSHYGMVDNVAFRKIRSQAPGPYEFILPATRELPRRLWQSKQKTVGLRLPKNEIAMALIKHLDEPLVCATVLLPGEDIPLTDPYDIESTLGNRLELVIDGGYCGIDPPQRIDLIVGDMNVA
jgi:tRNA threonylcarbamoyl adenosine modification protein (Sua5/YciO/YrdC/YwlC family)